MNYRRRSKIVEAHQWFKNGDHYRDYDCTLCRYTPMPKGSCDSDTTFCTDTSNCRLKANDYEGNVVRFYRTPNLDGKCICETCGKTMHEHGQLHNIPVCPGDWIIFSEGHFSVCKKADFKKEYEDIV